MTAVNFVLIAGTERELDVQESASTAKRNKEETRKVSAMSTEQKKGRFIVFEGIDGSGKSTQIRLLSERLKSEGVSCYTTMEPTDSPIGSMIHQIMIGRMKADNKVIAALFAADRLDHLLNDINGLVGKIDAGTTVISDRFYLSSYAYHSVDMPMEQVVAMNAPSRDLLHPTIHIFVDVDPDTAVQRIAANRQHTELFEKKSRLAKTRECYMEAIEKLQEEETIVIIDGTQSVEKIAEEVWENVRKFF